MNILSIQIDKTKNAENIFLCGEEKSSIGAVGKTLQYKKELCADCGTYAMKRVLGESTHGRGWYLVCGFCDRWDEDSFKPELAKPILKSEKQRRIAIAQKASDTYHYEKDKAWKRSNKFK